MSVKKYSIIISGHATSITLEPEFWIELCSFAKNEGITISKLISRIDSEPRNGGLSSALRVYVLNELKRLNTLFR